MVFNALLMAFAVWLCWRVFKDTRE
jgi:hypothetical protein